MGVETKDGKKLMAYLHKNYVEKYDLALVRMTYDNVAYSADLLNAFKDRYGDLMCTDTTPQKTRISIGMVKGWFMRREIRINPNALMAYSLSCSNYRITPAGYLQLVRDESKREDDGCKSLIYAVSGMIASNPSFYFEKIIE